MQSPCQRMLSVSQFALGSPMLGVLSHALASVGLPVASAPTEGSLTAPDPLSWGWVCICVFLLPRNLPDLHDQREGERHYNWPAPQHLQMHHGFMSTLVQSSYLIKELCNFDLTDRTFKTLHCVLTYRERKPSYVLTWLRIPKNVRYIYKNVRHIYKAVSTVSDVAFSLSKAFWPPVV